MRGCFGCETLMGRRHATAAQTAGATATWIILIVMPLSWLAVYSVTDRGNHLTLKNFITLFTDPDFLDPLLTTAIIATTSAAVCCIVAAPMGWLVSRTDMPGRQFIRAPG